MPNTKKYVSLAKLTKYDELLKAKMAADDAKVLSDAKSFAEGLAGNYEAAGAVATAKTELQGNINALANGAVKQNTDAIAKLNGDATTDGSVAKAVADAKALVDADVDAVESVANQNKTDIAAINNTETGILAQAKKFASDEDAKVQANVDKLSEYVGTIPEGATATDVVGYVVERTSGIATNTALAELQAAVDANKEDISGLKTKDGELVAKDEELAQAIAAVKEDVDAFFADADMTESAKDTLKELQTYIASDETAASQMAASIKANSDAISALETAGVTQDEKIAALEAKFGEGDGSVEDMIAAAKQEAVDTAAADATTKANQALTDSKAYTDTEVGKDRTRLDALEAVTHSHANKAELDLIATGDKAKWDDAAAKAHEHGNKDVLDGITATKISAWDAAEANAIAKANELNTAMTTKVDDAITRIGANETAISGLQTSVAGKAAQADLDAAVARIAANESAIASFVEVSESEINALFGITV